MILLFYFLVGFFSLLLLFQLFLIVSFIVLWKARFPALSSEPNISILLAVRNEAGNIVSCLEAIYHLNYPKNKVEVLIGDDASDDATWELAEQYIKDKPNYKLISITKRVGLAGAKGNVIAQLAHKASGEYFFITDADVRVPPTWIEGMLAACEEGVAIVSGSAMIDDAGLLARMQCIDWLTAFGMINTAVEAGIPITAVGNNMMVRREAYFATGGYEKIPFSVTEDLDLHEAVRKLGWRNRNLVHQNILSCTKSIRGIASLLQQRKRWMSGAMRLPAPLVAILTLQSLFFPMLITGLVLAPVTFICIWLGKILLQNIFLGILLRRIHQPLSLLCYCFVYELYAGLYSIALIIYYFLPVKTVWKGRTYAK